MAIKRKLNESVKELKRKRTIQGLLDYGVIAFGPEKKDYFLRVTNKPLIEEKHFTFRYIALIDVLIILGLVVGLLGNKLGWIWALFFFVMAVVVFVDAKEIEKRKGHIGQTLPSFIKEVIRRMK